MINSFYSGFADGYYSGGGSNLKAAFGLFIGICIIMFAIEIIALISYWKLFEKAKVKGWKSLIPIYNSYIMVLISGLPGWSVLLLFIPFVNVFYSIILVFNFLKAYGKGIGTFLLYLFFPYVILPYLAFSKNVEYCGNEIDLNT